MERPLEIVFHNMKPSPEIEAMIRERLPKLEKVFDRITGCRVSVELPHQRHKQGDVPEVHIELQVPGKTLVVRREHRAKQRHRTPTVRAVVHDAFETAATQLKGYKELLQRDVKPHPAPLTARVTRLLRDLDYGFITTSEGKELYFHRNSVMSGSFDGLKEGDGVQFVEAAGDTGPTAAKIWPTGNGR